MDRARWSCTRFEGELRPTAPESGCRHRYRSDHAERRPSTDAAYGYNAHGGYVEGGRFRNECRERVFAAIADVHGLTLEQVRNARATRTRDWRITLIAAVPFAALYYIGSVMVCRMWTARFSPDEHRQRFVAFAITSVAASIAGVQLAELWFNIAEMLRVGNDHLGQTRAFPTSSPYLLAMFVAGLRR